MTRRWCLLRDIAHAGLGYKSLQNTFFYLEPDAIRSYGIERRFLARIYLLDDLDSSNYCQHGVTTLRVFRCGQVESDLAGTGALRYIRAMAGRPANMKKQSGKPKTIKQVLSEQGGKHWYAPKAEAHRERIWVRKAFGSVYAPFLFLRPAIVDQRCNYISPADGVDAAALAAVVMSTVFALALEAPGAAAMGAGALEVATTGLRKVRVLDLRLLSTAQVKALGKLGKAAWEQEKPIDWKTAERPGPRMQRLDEQILEYLGNEVTSSQLYSDLREMMRVRLNLASDKERSNKQRVAQNVASVAEGVASLARPLLEGRRFPESFCDPGAADGVVNVEGHVRLVIRIEQVMSVAAVSVLDADTNETLFDETLPLAVGEVIVRALILGRRRMQYPSNPTVASAVLIASRPWRESIAAAISEGCMRSASGTMYLERLRDEVHTRLGINADLARQDLPNEITIST